MPNFVKKKKKANKLFFYNIKTNINVYYVIRKCNKYTK